MMGCEFDAPTQRRKSRKHHNCDGMCGGIKPGDVYTVDTVMREGKFYRYKFCVGCIDRARREINGYEDA